MKFRPGLVVLLGILLVLGGRHFLNAPVNSRATETVTVEIPEGSGARAIARILKDKGLIRSPLGFALAVTMHGDRERLHAGWYEIRARDSGREIIRRLVAGKVTMSDVSVTFPEGFTLAQVTARLAANGLASEQEIREAARVGKFRTAFGFLREVPDGPLEGYLFPDTYRFRRGSPPPEILPRLLRRFDDRWRAAVSAVCQGVRPAPCREPIHAVVTMASIIEREVRSSEDRRLVSGILWKRQQAGRGLDADATIRYALNEWEHPLTVGNLRLDSPYNTRRYRGLPPTPIGNPGYDSFVAALNPTPSEYLYYLSASADGRTVFSRTLDEHNRAKVMYLR